MTKVFLALPHYATVHAAALPGLMQASLEGHVKSVNLEGGSLLSLVFNRLWCRALNERAEKAYTHFAMHHADIQAPPGWVDVLLAELEKQKADVISAVVAIKDYRGLTSTGYREEFGPINRLTVNEVNMLPDTFEINDVVKQPHEKRFMVNTGLWLCRFTEEWIERVCFNICDGVFKQEDGSFRPKCLPEDWNFSGFCAREALKVVATRKLRVLHHGDSAFPNDGTWGAWDVDKGD
jgi:hypothetical protein